jgi:Zn-finger nucleic acid-binding protein
MDSVRRRGVVVDHCGGCGGHWFDRGELSAWIEGIGGDPEYLLDIAPEADPRRCRYCGGEDHGDGVCSVCGKAVALCCPRDGTDLLIVEEQGVQVDVCLKCHGIWFDGDELASIAQRWMAKAGHDIAGPPCQACGLPDSEGRTGGDGTYRCRDCHHDHLHGNEAATAVRKQYGEKWSSPAVAARGTNGRCVEAPEPPPSDDPHAQLGESIARFLT